MTESTAPASTETAAPVLPSAAKLRMFANDAGLPVGTRGFISSSVKDAFVKAPKRTQKKYL